MDRLSRAETQQRTRARVLTAAREEFVARGYREAKIDAIAERAGLTRGGVYSNFPGKRALYFAVLADDAERRAGEDAPVPPGRTAREALGAFARAWLDRLPLACDEDRAPGRLGVDLVPEILADERTRRPFAQLMRVAAILLGLSLERLHPAAGRRVAAAESVLTHLQGAAQLAAAAPGFIEEFTVVAACERLAGLELDDAWGPPHLAYAVPARHTDEPWPARPTSPGGASAPDAAEGIGDGVVAVLGLHRLGGIEEAVRAAPPGTRVTVALVTGEPGELADLARLVLTEVLGCLRPAFPPPARPDVRLVHDPAATLAAAAGIPAVSDATEAALLVRDGRIVARAEGWGACHAVASIA